jgi:hypothetical protein
MEYRLCREAGRKEDAERNERRAKIASSHGTETEVPVASSTSFEARA